MEYNFHDSVIVSASYNVKGRLELDIQLYEIFYPEKPMLKLIFSGIFNKKAIQSFYNVLVEDKVENDWIGYRIDGLEYDDKKISSKEDTHLYLEVDNFNPLKIHCKKLNIVQMGIG